MPTLSELADFINKVGTPVALLIAGIYFVYRTGKFAAPLIKTHSEKHLEFVDSVKEQNLKQSGILEKQNGLLEIVAGTVSEQAKTLGIIADAVKGDIGKR